MLTGSQLSYKRNSSDIQAAGRRSLRRARRPEATGLDQRLYLASDPLGIDAVMREQLLGFA